MPKTAGGSTYPQGKVREKSGKINAQFANADLSTNLFANLYYTRMRLRACVYRVYICVYINMGRLVSWLASRQMEDGGENAKYDIHPATDPLKEYIIPQVKTTFIFL